jgi:hypothetical protein
VAQRLIDHFFQRCVSIALKFLKSRKASSSMIKVTFIAARVYPRPTNGIWFAITVMNSTFVDSGRFAM